MALDRGRGARVHRIRRRTHELLGPAGRVARRENSSRAGGQRHRAPLPRICGHLRREEVKLAPSILAADFARLGEQVAEAESAGADRIHIDIMDGHFVPNLSMGPPIVKSLRPVTRLPLETHLMIRNPDIFIDEFAAAGTDVFLVHWEGSNDLSRTVQRIKTLKKRVGVAINPATPPEV